MERRNAASESDARATNQRATNGEYRPVACYSKARSGNSRVKEMQMRGAVISHLPVGEETNRPQTLVVSTFLLPIPGTIQCQVGRCADKSSDIPKLNASFPSLPRPNSSAQRQFASIRLAIRVFLDRRLITCIGNGCLRIAPTNGADGHESADRR